jgi:alpha-galactosidase
LITFFNIFKSPLFFGGDLPSNDAFTLSLLTNKEVVKMHNESTDVKQLFQKDGKIAVTSKNAKDGSVYLALFNISDSASEKVSVNLSDLGVLGSIEVLNMWTGEKSKVSSKEILADLKPHSSILYKIKSKK